MTNPSPTPARFTSGVSTDFPFGPLATFGRPNPFGYFVVADDFAASVANNPLWTIYSKSTGSAANTTALGGGRVTLTTAAAASDVEAIQCQTGLINPNAGIVVGTAAGKKIHFLTRLQMSSISATGPTLVAGIITESATPSIAPANGIYFSINGGVASLNIAIASAVTALALPTTCYATQANPAAVAMAAATYYDMGFYVNRNQNLVAFFGQQLVGYFPQNGTGVLNSQGNSVLPALGAVASLSGATLPNAVLALSLVLQEGADAAAVTAGCDFIMASQER